MKKRFFKILAGACLLVSTLAQAQTTQLGNGVIGHWNPTYTIAKQNWKAQWVWDQQDTKRPTTNNMVLFRKSFTISDVPSTAIIKISASSLYKLYINGTYVNRGPSRSAPHNQSFDELDITTLLKEGKNAIAVQANYQQGEHANHLLGRGGMLAQLEMQIGNTTEIIATNSSWKAMVDPSWDNNAPKLNRFQLVVADRVDLTKEIKGWNKVDFDDSEWRNAVGLIRNSGWPGPQKNDIPRAITTPWTNLEKRHIPYLTEVDHKAINLIEAVQIEDYLYHPKKAPKRQLTGKVDKNISVKAYKKGKGPLVIPALKDQKTFLLVFDLGEMINGMPQFDIEGVKGTKVEVIGIPYMVNNQFTYRVVDTDLLDEVILSGQRDVWQAQYFKPSRYLALVIKSGDAPIKINSFGIHQFAYPFEKKGSITSKSHDWVEQYVVATEKTIDACTTDGYTDNYRERRQYAQTGYYGAMGNYWTFGDYALQAIKLVQVAQEAEPNGLLPAYGPLVNNDYMVILDSDILWIRSLHNYYLYSGDKETVLKLMPTAQKLMDLLESYTNKDGLLDNPPYSYWLDHARNDRRGANLNLNGHYIGALQDYTEILSWLGKEGAKSYTQQAKLAKEAIQTQFWNNQKGLFVDALIDGKQSDQYSEHAQAMALSMQIATEEQAKAVAKNILENDELNYVTRASGMYMVTPAMSYFLHKGLAEYGYVDQSFDLFRKRFDHMLAPEMNGTLWEEWWRDASGRTGKKGMIGRTRSDAQTESAFAPGLFAEFLVGVEITKPGMAEMVLAKTTASIENIAANIPTPFGSTSIAWTFENEGGQLNVEIPEGVEIKLVRKSFGKDTIEVDNIINKETTDYIKLKAGKHNVTFSSKEI
ncbi:hypothetical protein EI427_22420 [Flammeovirga pectinis]|uniref:Alpha-L-rhamnosidase n=1 Tax=Flammeovirga pectinis TaxID=2494373 RepID=A0A3Q9FPL9_9BACT|nr:alpha-L-rhamnosidase N-terminal domain-containing protein [Flammeovirga pectinis]AZQ64979.1 hypothetical protein EI427_22420 [Flammeovirga pectinis]